MKNYVFILMISVFLASCSKQPSEIQKANVEKELVQCIVMTNEDPRGDEVGGNLFTLLSAYGGMVEKAESIDSKSWQLFDESEPHTINVKFKIDDITYSCDYSDSENGIELVEVRRNKEAVFNKKENDIIVANKKARLEAEVAEKARLEAEAKEAKRLQEISTWKEMSYSNAAYKYYQKRHKESNDSWGEPLLKVECNPKFPQVEFDDGQLRFDGQKQVEFGFTVQEKNIIKKFDLNYNGTVGTWDDSGWVSTVRVESKPNQEFIDLMKNASDISVAGFSFNTDDLTQIPCI
jgi:hypothetical protein